MRSSYTFANLLSHNLGIYMHQPYTIHRLNLCGKYNLDRVFVSAQLRLSSLLSPSTGTHIPPKTITGTSAACNRTSRQLS